MIISIVILVNCCYISLVIFVVIVIINVFV